MFTNQDVSNYYDHTEVHYRQFWRLEESMALHYGFWNKETKTFNESLKNTNSELASLAGVKSGDCVLDAGCGVGGSSVFLANNYGCKVTGITLSERQVKRATANALKFKLEKETRFFKKDYTNTEFEAASFDVIWALESVGTAQDKQAFIKEAFRLLKKDGRLIMADYFIKNDISNKKDQRILRRWLDGWAISNLTTIQSFEKMLENGGFASPKILDYTERIRHSAKRLYRAAMMGWLGTKLYVLFNPKATAFGRGHAISSILQYKALKRGLWRYKVILAKKA
jgi:cyclopropane fatty-acyl-phospholipid synthase-like methyltransferase